MGRRGRDERGQGLLEFALVAPALLLLSYGVFDFGRGMSANVTVTNSAREGARYASANAVNDTASYAGGTGRYACPDTTTTTPTAPDSTTVQGAAWRQLTGASLDTTKVTITVRFWQSAHDPTSTTADDTVTCTAGSRTVTQSAPSYVPATGDRVQVEVSYRYAPSTPVISTLVSSVTVDQTAIMVLE